MLYASFESHKTVELTQHLKIGVTLLSETTNLFYKEQKHMTDPEV